MNGMTGGALASQPTQSREGDNFLANDQEQLSRWANLMRRVEDLSDRVSGAQASAAGDNPKPPQAPGFIGALYDLHGHRDEIGVRFAAALDRIERVL